ncbi:unnamed protein product, partial [marine sediment metagenome]
MPLKKKTTFKKQEFEYDSPDGDKWDFIIVECENRKYVQFKKEGKEEIV